MKVSVLAVLAFIFVCSGANPVTLFKPFHGHGWGKFDKVPPIDPNTPKSPTYYFDSKIDNFDPNNFKTYKQRYWYSTQWYKPGGPQFLMVGGETEMSSGWVDSGGSQFGMLAKEVGAAVFTLEHRFYGESQPTGDLTFQSLKFLTSEQALADIKAFIISMNAQFKFNHTRWITFGGSYPGALSAWARQMYPNLIYAAVASSAPVQAVVDNSEYLEVVFNALKNYDPKCAESVHRGFLKLNELMKTFDGKKQVSKLFNTCYQLQNDSDNISYFYEAIIDPYMNEIQDSDAATIANLCSVQTSGSDGLEGIVAVYHYYVAGDQCLNTDYATFLLYLRKTDLSNVGWAGSILKISILFKNILQGTKVVFPSGTNDPWHVLGVLSPTNDKTYPIIIDGASHCADMIPNSATDTPALIEARKKIRSHVLSWVYE
uniref:Serine protease K12H4.7 n=1 Tax=Panagrolaimus sp. ES5 TaxID=591445 RepID=A0AC34G293_9BILA